MALSYKGYLKGNLKVEILFQKNFCVGKSAGRRSFLAFDCAWERLSLMGKRRQEVLSCF